MLELESLSVGQYGFISNVFSFGFAVMASATLFLWLMTSSVAPAYRMAITISGLVTAIAAYHYLQIMLSWHGAASVTTGDVLASGEGFNRAYRYVDWLLTVPLLLVELILVMKLSIYSGGGFLGILPDRLFATTAWRNRRFSDCCC